MRVKEIPNKFAHLEGDRFILYKLITRLPEMVKIRCGKVSRRGKNCNFLRARLYLPPRLGDLKFHFLVLCLRKEIQKSNSDQSARNFRERDRSACMSTVPYITASRVAKGANAKWVSKYRRGTLPLGHALFYMHSFISLSEIYGKRSESGTIPYRTSLRSR